LTDIELIKKEIGDLEKLACEIENLGAELLDSAPLNYKPDPPGVLSPFPQNEWGTLDPDLRDIQRLALRNYQRFYSVGLQFVKEFLPEKEIEFCASYEAKEFNDNEGVMDYLQLRKGQYSNDKEDIIERFINRLEVQRSILSSIPYIARIQEIKLREIISADYVEREIEEAEQLFRKGNFRAAGALAGVALEKYLKTLCDKYQIDYQKKDTIEPLVEKLYRAKKIDITLMKKIQYLASIRDKCDHPSDVEKGEVKELIEKVKKFI
jgi:HEPN domain-containing protein